MAELLIGCGRSRAKVLSLNGVEWKELVTLDSDPSCKPDVVHDLEVMPYPFEDERFDECNAYDVLEHMGRQGDWQFFFGHCWRGHLELVFQQRMAEPSNGDIRQAFVLKKMAHG